MELLNDDVINLHRFEIISTVLKVHYQNRNNLRVMISYNEFKDTIISLVRKIMYLYLNKTQYCFDKCSCVIKKLPGNDEGWFDSKNNEITIDEDVIKEIYCGNIDKMIVIFHELNHFKVLYDLKLEKINFDLIRIAKEKLIRLDMDANEFKNTKSTEFSESDLYYTCNYKIDSEEKYVDNMAVKDFILFCKLANIELEQNYIEYLEKVVSDNLTKKENNLRDFRYDSKFNSYFLDFEEAFDILIKRNPKWIRCPQLKIEYYLDANGEVKKRNKDELLELKNNVKDEETKQIIQEILDFETKRRLDKKDFYSNSSKIIKEDFYNKIENNNRKK